MKQRRHPGRTVRSKETRALISAIKAAGGTVVLTTRGHLKATGPDGFAIVGSSSQKNDRHGRANAIRDLRKYAGLDVALT